RPQFARPVVAREAWVGAVTRSRCPGSPCGAGIHERPRGARRQHPLEGGAPVHHSSLRRMRSRIWSAARHAKAMMVRVGFLSALEANTAPSVTNRFGTSQLWHQALVTELRASVPMTAPPTS